VTEVQLTHQRVVDPVVLPRVFDEENVKQQVGVVAHVVPVRETAVPQKFGEQSLGELRIFPAAVLQEFEAIFTDVRVLDEFLDVAGEKT
jgi:hypothetical protein